MDWKEQHSLELSLTRLAFNLRRVMLAVQSEEVGRNLLLDVILRFDETQSVGRGALVAIRLRRAVDLLKHTWSLTLDQTALLHLSFCVPLLLVRVYSDHHRELLLARVQLEHTLAVAGPALHLGRVHHLV